MKPLVLVLDDSLTERMALRTLLSAAGCLVTACGTVQMARDMIRRRAFDLAILDIVLPDGNGMTLMEEIKIDPQINYMSVIMLSSLASAHEEVGEVRKRADAYVQKPFNPEALVQLVTDLMRQGLGGKRYLVIDDSPTFLQALSSKLRQAENEVLTASSGEEALEILHTERVDCIILDMIMPGMGGLAACQQIRALPFCEQVPIFMMTASENLNECREGLTIGADEFLIKQDDIDMMYARLRSILRKLPTRTWRKGDGIGIPKGSTAGGSPGFTDFSDKVLLATGLSHWVARLALRRACASVGIKHSELTPQTFPQILPALSEYLRMFLPPAEVAGRLAALNGLVLGLEN